VRAAGLNMMKIMVDDAVYGRREDCVFSHRTALWTAVPNGVLTKYVTDPALVSEIKELLKKEKPLRTLFCADDRNLKRTLRLTKYFYSYYRTYARYYFDKQTGKGR
jgi:D-aspartate ligase